jgi:hypothetical protein
MRRLLRVGAASALTLVFNSVMVIAADAKAAPPPNVLNPGRGTAPPGFDKFATVIGWVTYIAIACCVLGFIICGAKLAVEHHNGGGGGIGGQVGKVMGACVLIGAAFGIVNALV